MAESTGLFVDRLVEIASLERAWVSDGAHLVLLTGRRRVGKSALLRHFADRKRIGYLAAAQRLRADQLVDAGRALAPVTGGIGAPSGFGLALSRWDDFLGILEETGSHERVGFIIDEFPYLVTESPELPSLIQRWWDRIRDTSQVFLVLAGSQQAAMRQLTSSDAPLFGRATLRPHIRPLDYFQAAQFVPRWSAEDRIRAYAVAGGIPEYLRQFDDRKPFWDNVVRLAFDPDGALFREADYLFEAEFREVSRRGSILRAIAGGATRPSEIARSIGLGSAADIFANLRDLVDLGLCQREVPATDADAGRNPRVRYRIADPYLRFYFGIVDPRRSAIAAGLGQEVANRVSGELFDQFVSHTFEDVARQYAWRLSAIRALPVVERVGRWWQAAEEIDLVAIGGGRVVAVGEAKWQRSPMDGRDLAALRRKALALDGADESTFLLVSRSGFHDSLAPSGRVRLATLGDLFHDTLEYEREGPPSGDTA